MPSTITFCVVLPTLIACSQLVACLFKPISKWVTAELSDPARLAYWQEQYAEYKKLANKHLNRANRRFFGENSTAAAKDKFYSTLRGFIIAQLRKEA